MDNFYIAREQQKTIFHNLKTLYVKGVDFDPNEIRSLAHVNNCEHVYLGADRSLATSEYMHYFQFLEDTIEYLIRNKNCVSLEIPHKYYAKFLENSKHTDNDFFNLVLTVEVNDIPRTKNVTFGIVAGNNVVHSVSFQEGKNI